MTAKARYASASRLAEREGRDRRVAQFRFVPPRATCYRQPHVHVAEDRDGIRVNLERALRMIDFGVGYAWELPARLVVFPEYFLQGVTTPGKGEHGIDSFMKKAITFDGPEIAALADKAREYGLYIAGGGVVEKVPEFPDRWFKIGRAHV